MVGHTHLALAGHTLSQARLAFTKPGCLKGARVGSTQLPKRTTTQQLLLTRVCRGAWEELSSIRHYFFAHLVHAVPRGGGVEHAAPSAVAHTCRSHTHTHMHAHMHRTHMHACAHAHMHARTHPGTRTRKCTRTRPHTQTHMHRVRLQASTWCPHPSPSHAPPPQTLAPGTHGIRKRT